MTGRAFFEAVADALVGFLPPSLRAFSSYHTSANLKVWYGVLRQEHYEVQHLSAHALRGTTTAFNGPAVEIGFHAEHKERSRNDEVLERLVANQKAWRRALGRDVEAGAFIGHQSGSWRRVSELWRNDGSPDIAIDAADRLATYIKAFEPIRRKG